MKVEYLVCDRQHRNNIHWLTHLELIQSKKCLPWNARLLISCLSGNQKHPSACWFRALLNSPPHHRIISKAEDGETVLLHLISLFARKSANHWAVLFLSYFPSLLPRALSNLTGKQQVSTSQEAARQKLSVLSSTKTSPCLLGSFCCCHLNILVSFFLKGWTLQQSLLEFLSSF